MDHPLDESISQQTGAQGPATAIPDAVQPSDQYWLDTGNASYEQEAYEEALAAYKQAVQITPVPLVIYMRMGESLFQLGHYDQALTAYEQVLQREPENVYAYNCSGNALYRLGLYAQARVAYQQAIRLEPQ